MEINEFKRKSFRVSLEFRSSVECRTKLLEVVIELRTPEDHRRNFNQLKVSSCKYLFCWLGKFYSPGLKDHPLNYVERKQSAVLVAINSQNETMFGFVKHDQFFCS